MCGFHAYFSGYFETTDEASFEMLPSDFEPFHYTTGQGRDGAAPLSPARTAIPVASEGVGPWSRRKDERCGFRGGAAGL